MTDRSLLSTWPEDVPYYTPPPTFMPDPPRIFGNLPDPAAFSDVADAQDECTAAAMAPCKSLLLLARNGPTCEKCGHWT